MTASTSVRPLAADILAHEGYGKEGRANSHSQARSQSPAGVLNSLASAAAAARAPMPAIELPDLSSQSQEDTSFRAYFLAVAVSNNHKLMLCSMAEKLGCDLQCQSIQEKVKISTKILTCASLFQIGLESGGISNRDSVMKLLLSALRVVEKISPQVSVKELLAAFGECDPSSFNQVLCRKVAKVFDIAEERAQPFEAFLCSETTYRKEISSYACKQGVESLRQQLAVFL